MTTAKAKAQAKFESINTLKDWGLKPGDTIYVINRHTAASGMTRSLTFYKIENDTPVWLSWHMAKAGIGRWNDKRETVDMSGCGRDMGFAAVYELSSLMFPDGFGCIGDDCPSNDHSNGDRSYEKHGHDFSHWHTDSGYTFKHRWLS